MRRLALAGPRSAGLIHCCLFCAICGHSGPLFHCRCVVHGGVAYGMFTRVGDCRHTGGAGVVYSGSFKGATGYHCGGCFIYSVWPGLRVALGLRRVGGCTAFTSAAVSASPGQFVFSTPVDAMEWLPRFHCSVSNGWWQLFIFLLLAQWVEVDR